VLPLGGSKNPATSSVRSGKLLVALETCVGDEAAVPFPVPAWPDYGPFTATDFGVVTLLGNGCAAMRTAAPG
jgi:hypothetical protein